MARDRWLATAGTLLRLSIIPSLVLDGIVVGRALDHAQTETLMLVLVGESGVLVALAMGAAWRGMRATEGDCE